jgi:PIN domain nuclease of toxin-antitoxin system
LTYLADTHVVIWWHLASPELPAVYHKFLQEAESRGPRIGVSAISLWEIAKLYERGRLRLNASLDQCLADVENSAAFDVLPLNASVAAESLRLGPTYPRDPADQLIGATARCFGLSLLTVDRFIRGSKAVALA